MNREIEFRAWDKRNKKYYQPVFLGDDGEVHAYVSKRHDIDCIGDIKEFDIEQYTELKDKNGNKIFEGDMITCDDVIYEVYYAESGFKAMISIDGETFGGEYDLDSLSPVEIIGNIHEEVK